MALQREWDSNKTKSWNKKSSTGKNHQVTPSFLLDFSSDQEVVKYFPDDNFKHCSEQNGEITISGEDWKDYKNEAELQPSLFSLKATYMPNSRTILSTTEKQPNTTEESNHLTLSHDLKGSSSMSKSYSQGCSTNDFVLRETSEPSSALPGTEDSLFTRNKNESKNHDCHFGNNSIKRSSGSSQKSTVLDQLNIDFEPKGLKTFQSDLNEGSTNQNTFMRKSGHVVEDTTAKDEKTQDDFRVKELLVIPEAQIAKVGVTGVSGAPLCEKRDCKPVYQPAVDSNLELKLVLDRDMTHEKNCFPSQLLGPCGVQPHVGTNEGPKKRKLELIQLTEDPGKNARYWATRFLYILFYLV